MKQAFKGLGTKVIASGGPELSEAKIMYLDVLRMAFRAFRASYSIDSEVRDGTNLMSHVHKDTTEA